MLDDPFSTYYAYTLALQSGAQMVVNPRRDVARMLWQGRSYAVDAREAQRYVQLLLEAPETARVCDRITYSTKRRTASVAQLRRERIPTQAQA